MRVICARTADATVPRIAAEDYDTVGDQICRVRVAGQQPSAAHRLEFARRKRDVVRLF